MRSFHNKPAKRRRVIITSDEGAPRVRHLPIWWDESASRIMAGSGDNAEPILSPRHMALLCERGSHVVVSRYDDQAPAVSALGQACPPEKISVVYGMTLMPPSWDRQWSPIPDIVYRRYILPYDNPLRRLQTAVSLSADANLIDLFRATPAGEFHEFWGLPYTAEAAKLWAAVGDLFVYSLPTDIESIEFRYKTPKWVLSAIRPKRPSCNLAEFDGGIDLLKFLQRISMTAVCRNRTFLPPEPCRIERIAGDVFKRRAIRRLLPQAWAGTPEPRSEVQKRAADSSPGSLNDPRSWIWRALLNATEEEVGRAYLEAGIAWVLARLRHPELFPPFNPLFDVDARRYFTEKGSPFTKTREQRP